MEVIGLPSWFQKAPKNPGDVKWGKFKADEWKAFCTVNLPITLTRLWGSRPKTDKHYQMLENFMHLVAAVKIATMRVLNSADIDLYDQHMKLYLKGFAMLYPFINITPYQHLALHFSTHLRRFGPTHSWRCFAFERYNGIIQDIPSNYKFGKTLYRYPSYPCSYAYTGEMEESKFLRFCRIQNLRVLFNESRLPPQLLSIVSLYEKRFQISINGTLSEDFGVKEDIARCDIITDRRKILTETDKFHIQLLGEWFSKQSSTYKSLSKAAIVAHVERNGKRFQSGNAGNGHVVFQVFREGVRSYLPGRIMSIISLPRPQQDTSTPSIHILIRRYQTLSEEDTASDFYRGLAHCGYLVYNDLEPTYTVVPFRDVIAHFAFAERQVSGIERKCLHVLPLSP